MASIFKKNMSYLISGLVFFSLCVL